MLRSANDKRRWDADLWRRYRCRSDSCSWQGLLQVSRGQRTRPSNEPGSTVLVRLARTMLLLLLAGGLAWGLMQALQFMIGT